MPIPRLEVKYDKHCAKLPINLSLHTFIKMRLSISNFIRKYSLSYLIQMNDISFRLSNKVKKEERFLSKSKISPQNITINAVDWAVILKNPFWKETFQNSDRRKNIHVEKIRMMNVIRYHRTCLRGGIVIKKNYGNQNDVDSILNKVRYNRRDVGTNEIALAILPSIMWTFICRKTGRYFQSLL